jgi:hypothetical protein
VELQCLYREYGLSSPDTNSGPTPKALIPQWSPIHFVGKEFILTIDAAYLLNSNALRSLSRNCCHDAECSLIEQNDFGSWLVFVSYGWIFPGAVWSWKDPRESSLKWSLAGWLCEPEYHAFCLRIWSPSCCWRYMTWYPSSGRYSAGGATYFRQGGELSAVPAEEWSYLWVSSAVNIAPPFGLGIDVMIRKAQSCSSAEIPINYYLFCHQPVSPYPLSYFS